MKQLDPVVKKETLRIALGVAVVGVLTQIVFALIGKWSVPVLAGGVLGSVWAVLNFLLMGITVQNSVGLDAALARRKVQASYTVRSLVTCGVVLAAILIPWFHWVPAVIAVFAPRMAIAVMTAFRRDYGQPVEDPLPVPEEDEDDEQDELERIMDRVYGSRVDYSDCKPEPASDRSEKESPAAQAANREE